MKNTRIPAIIAAAIFAGTSAPQASVIALDGPWYTHGLFI